MTTLGYANERGYEGSSNRQSDGTKHCCEEPLRFSPFTKGRSDLLHVDTTNPDYLQEAGIPLSNETHGGEDVAIFATGPDAYLFRGSMEENWIFYVMADAFRLRRSQ